MGSHRHGEQRYRCKGCRGTFTAFTGTPLCRTHRKELLLEYAACMRNGLSVKKTAERTGLKRHTVYEWLRRLMPDVPKHQPFDLVGIAESDETFFPLSFKGKRAKDNLLSEPKKRDTPASKRGISDQQVPVLTTVARGTRTPHIVVLTGPPKAADAVAALAPVLRNDQVVLCTDAGSAIATAATELHVIARKIPAGVHKLGPYHIQNVNAPHSRLKRWLSGFRGVSTKCLPYDLGWFRFFENHNPSAVAFLVGGLDIVGETTAKPSGAYAMLAARRP